MRTRLASQGLAKYFFLGRGISIAIGCFAIWWGVNELPVFWRESPVERIASRIVAGEPFKPAILAAQLPIIESIETASRCRPTAIRAAAVLRLRTVEVDQTTNDRYRWGEDEKLLEREIRSSLSCAPADPFLWLVLFSVENNKNHTQVDHLEFLRMSYQLGPNEGWIAQNRNRVASEIIQQLPSDLAQKMRDEFVALIVSKFYEPTAKIFIGLPPPEREKILSQLAFVSLQDRKLFAEALQRHGSNIAIPGVAPVTRGP